MGFSSTLTLKFIHMKKDNNSKFYYNIHDILGIESNIEILPGFFKGEPKNIDLEVKEGNFDFDSKGLNKLGLKCHGGNDKLFMEYKFYGKPIQKVLIEDV